MGIINNAETKELCNNEPQILVFSGADHPELEEQKTLTFLMPKRKKKFYKDDYETYPEFETIEIKTKLAPETIQRATASYLYALEIGKNCTIWGLGGECKEITQFISGLNSIWGNQDQTIKTNISESNSTQSNIQNWITDSPIRNESPITIFSSDFHIPRIKALWDINNFQAENISFIGAERFIEEWINYYYQNVFFGSYGFSINVENIQQLEKRTNRLRMTIDLIMTGIIRNPLLNQLVYQNLEKLIDKKRRREREENIEI